MSGPNPGDFFTTATTGKWYDRFFAWAIRFFTATKVPAKRSWRTLWRNHVWVYPTVNHAGIFLGYGEIAEAVKKLKIGSIAEYPDASWSKIPLTAGQRAKIIEFADNQVGKGYNWLGLLGVGLAQERFGTHLKELTRSWWVKQLSDGKSWFCSQFVDAAYAYAGVQLFNDGRETGLVSPADLFNVPNGH